MGYIYKITNKINGKCYIGKTELTPEIRFKRHINTWRKGKDRPLYRAFNKYGIENFSIETLEEVNDKILPEREVYYIEKFNTYRNGYNATKGGDGKSYLDYEMIYKTYLECNRSYSKTAKILHISKGNLSRKLERLFNEPRHSANELKESLEVEMFSLEGIKLNEFKSTKDALLFLQNENPNIKSSITIRKACNGKRKTAHGYIWKYKIS